MNYKEKYLVGMAGGVLAGVLYEVLLQGGCLEFLYFAD